jgi:vacuolar protein sorting-associated protein 1
MTTSYIKNAASYLGNGLIGYMTQKDIFSGFDRLSGNELIKIGDMINDIFGNESSLDPPNVCVVGMQSCGKSITLNSLTGLDILPNGKQIVTRTPIKIRMIHSEEKDILIEFICENGEKISEQIITPRSTNDPTNNTELEKVRKEIERLTTEYAGNEKNVVDRPIVIKITSPNVPNLSIIDLPGLTNIALTDYGQSPNIKESIEKMIINYISNPRTIILSIVPATIDVESDMGLGLIGKYDPGFRRTICAITKIDLMKESDMECYLSGRISKNLHLSYGYFLIKNRSSEDMKTMSIKDAYEAENKFFNEHPVYSASRYKDRMGSLNLGDKLSKILIEHIREHLPKIIGELNEMKILNERKLDEIGRDFPIDTASKKMTMNILLNEFQRTFRGSILDKGSNYNTGALLASIYRIFKCDIDKIDPFSKQILPDAQITEIIRNYEGVHMPGCTLDTGIIESFFQEENYILSRQNKIANKVVNPIKLMLPPTNKCIGEAKAIITSSIDNILSKDKYSRFPKLCDKMKEIINSSIILQIHDGISSKVSDLFIAEIEYIWTDDVKFRSEILPTMFNKTRDSDIGTIRGVLNGYYNSIKEIMKHNIQKYIHVFFVKKIINEIENRLHGIMNTCDVDQMLSEEPTKASYRQELLESLNKIEKVKTLICTISYSQ